MNKTEVTDVVLTTLVDDHELRLPKFLVVGNLIMVRLAFTNFENGPIAFERDLNILQLSRVNTLKFQFESLLRKHIRTEQHLRLLQYARLVNVFSWHVLETEVTEDWVVLEVLHSWIQIIFVSNTKGIGIGIARFLKLCLVQLQLMLQSAVTVLVHGLANEVTDQLDDNLGVIVNADDVIVLNHKVLPLAHVLCSVGLNLVNFCQLSEILNELISSACFLRLEKAEPEDLGVDTRAQLLADLFGQIVVHDVLEIDRVELVGPWVQNLEALMVHILGSESLNILLDELKVSLVGLDGIAQIILINSFFVVSEEGANGLDARCALQVL